MDLKNKDILNLNREDLTGLLEDTIEKGASLRFKASGFSMIPFIRNGDVVVVSPLSKDMDLFGRTVAAIHPGSKNLAVHRVVGTTGGDYILKGDNVVSVDGIVPKKDILGYVSNIERRGRKVLIGLGLERSLIALMSRINMVFALVRCVKKLPFFPKNAK